LFAAIDALLSGTNTTALELAGTSAGGQLDICDTSSDEPDPCSRGAAHFALEATALRVSRVEQVPAPASLALFGLGAAALLTRRRRA
jgi:hypothetical protein